MLRIASTAARSLALATSTRAAMPLVRSMGSVHHSLAKRPDNVGIHAMDIYFPKTYVSQSALEKHDNVGAGKYTKGLGLNNMAFCNDREDVNSIFLTAITNFMEKFNIDPKSVGRLECGTETLIDKSKAVKTVLMQVFNASGNTSLEGVDNLNACYGGTAALLNSAAWVESTAWDGRYALVVCGDIAVYEKGNARPTGGAGVVTMLIGPDAPVALEPGLRASHFEHAYDFYKPNLESEYPVVDGHYSISCYLRALDKCYAGYIKRHELITGKSFNFRDDADYVAFHTPFVRQSNKAYARLGYQEMLRNPERFDAALRAFASIDVEKSYTDRNLEKAFLEEGKAHFERQVQPTNTFASELGNSYTASLYASLASTLLHDAEAKRRMLLFSYGSGLASTMFSLNFRKPTTDVIKRDDIKQRLQQRVSVEPAEFERILSEREQHKGTLGSTDGMFPGTFYLKEIDSMQRRFYERK